MGTFLYKLQPHQTVFPKTNRADFNLANRLIREKWNRFYPLVGYEPIINVPALVPFDEKTSTGHTQTIAAPSDNGAVWSSPSTVRDTLWGEDIPATMATEDGEKPVQEWNQPHFNPSLNATASRRYFDKFLIRAHVLYNPDEKESTHKGTDEKRDVVITIPVVILDDVELPDGRHISLRPEAGDRITWDNEQYEVNVVNEKGYWKFTAAFLYIQLECNKYRHT